MQSFFSKHQARYIRSFLWLIWGLVFHPERRLTASANLQFRATALRARPSRWSHLLGTGHSFAILTDTLLRFPMDKILPVLSRARPNNSVRDFPSYRPLDALALSFQAFAGHHVALFVASCVSVLVASNVARLHFRKLSCCVDGADADLGINRARRTHSFSGVVGVWRSTSSRLGVQNVGQVLSGWV